MAISDRQRWNDKYTEKGVSDVISPDNWLCEVASAIIPGRALDLACGLGQNAIWLGLHGWQVDAVDISDVGLALASQSAVRAGCSTINWFTEDLDFYVSSPATYDLITVFRFLDRQRLPALIESALRPGGMLIYETFTQQQLARSDNHLKNDRFTLRSGELPLLFPDLIVEHFEEVELPNRCVARLAARKPSN